MNFVKKYWPHLLLICFLSILIFLTYKDYGTTWDEKEYIDIGKYFLSGIYNFLNIPHSLDFGNYIPTTEHLKTHGVVYDILVAFLQSILAVSDFDFIHLIRALLAVPVFILTALITREFLDRKYGVISFLLLLFFPVFYGSIFNNPIDVPSSLFFAASIWYFIRFYKGKQGIWSQIFFAFILALTINQRSIFWYVFLLSSLALFAQELLLKKKQIFFVVKKIFTIFIFLLFFMNFSNPYLLKHPITGIFEMAGSSKDYPFNVLVFFEGSLRSSRDLPWYYLPKLILITTPLVTITLFFIGLIKLIRLIRPMNLIAISKKILYLYLIALFFVPILLVMLFRPLIYDSWRQYLFLTIPIVIIATFGLQTILNLIKNQYPTPINTKHQSPNKKSKLVIVHWLLVLVIGFLIIIGYSNTALEMVRLHPYQYTFYNSLVGGLKGAYGKYEIDYWGAGFKEAVLWFNKNIYKEGKTYYIATDGNRFSLIPYFKKNTRITFNPIAANYMFTFTRWGFFLKLPGKIIYTLERKGVPIIFIKEVNPVR